MAAESRDVSAATSRQWSAYRFLKSPSSRRHTQRAREEYWPAAIQKFALTLVERYRAANVVDLGSQEYRESECDRVPRDAREAAHGRIAIADNSDE
jgi:hypothetical protein